ncbi:hypothetical protein KM043_006227 [Ampulex compressa]|nr:hypothetical protein KM043_006227 [Ampulex compressa]
MHTDNYTDDAPRYKALAKPKSRVDKNHDFDAFEVKRGALSYRISNTLNKLAQPKGKPGTNFLDAAPTSRNSSRDTEKRGNHKLINSNEQSRDALESRKKRFLMDSYARITAAKNRRFPKRPREPVGPKHQNNSDPEDRENSDKSSHRSAFARQPKFLLETRRRN